MKGTPPFSNTMACTLAAVMVLFEQGNTSEFQTEKSWATIDNSLLRSSPNVLTRPMANEEHACCKFTVASSGWRIEQC